MKKLFYFAILFILMLMISICTNNVSAKENLLTSSYNIYKINTIKYDDANEFKNKYIGNMTCVGIESFTFHERVPKLTSTVYNLIKIAIPIILVIKGMLDMFKSMSSGKEDEMKKTQKKFINRLIAGVCAFLVFILVETIIGWISTATNNQGAMNCVNCFINGPEYCQTNR